MKNWSSDAGRFKRFRVCVSWRSNKKYVYAGRNRRNVAGYRSEGNKKLMILRCRLPMTACASVATRVDGNGVVIDSARSSRYDKFVLMTRQLSFRRLFAYSSVAQCDVTVGPERSRRAIPSFSHCRASNWSAIICRRSERGTVCHAYFVDVPIGRRFDRRHGRQSARYN